MGVGYPVPCMLALVIALSTASLAWASDAKPATGATCAATFDHAGVLERTRAALEASGHTVRTTPAGNGTSLLPFRCEDDNPSIRQIHGCFFQNPASPYAMLEIPRGDPQSDHPWPDDPPYHHFRQVQDASPRPRNHRFRLEPHEGAVVVGCTPPPMRSGSHARRTTPPHTTPHHGTP